MVVSSSLVQCQLSQYTPRASGQDRNNNNRQGAGGGGRRPGRGAVSGGRAGGGQGGGGGDSHQGLDWLRDSVPGEPGVDYPVFTLPVADNDFR